MPASRVSLRRLRKLYLAGGPYKSSSFKPYLWDHFRRDRRLHDLRLVIKTHTSPSRLFIRAEVKVFLPQRAPPGVVENLTLDLITATPRDRAYLFDTNIPMNRLNVLLVAMPKIRLLSLHGATFSKGYLQPSPNGPHTGTKLLPSLRSLYLENVILDDDWGHLKTYLVHQASDKQAISLGLGGDSPRLCTEMTQEIGDLGEGWRSLGGRTSERLSSSDARASKHVMNLSRREIPEHEPRSETLFTYCTPLTLNRHQTVRP